MKKKQSTSVELINLAKQKEENNKPSGNDNSLMANLKKGLVARYQNEHD